MDVNRESRQAREKKKRVKRFCEQKYYKKYKTTRNILGKSEFCVQLFINFNARDVTKIDKYIFFVYVAGDY